MRKTIAIACIMLAMGACKKDKSTIKNREMTKAINESLPTIGILIFDGFLTNELAAPLDVFARGDSNGNTLFNVITIAKEDKLCKSDEGLRVAPDFTIQNTPKLDVLVVPSSMNPENQTSDSALIDFIKKQYESTTYMASHCAGAFMLGEAGVANGKEIVTYCMGSDALQSKYPELLVQDDSKVAVVKDGKIISSNGNLVSYIASLDLLEIMTSRSHRKYVEEQLLLNKLKNN